MDTAVLIISDKKREGTYKYIVEHIHKENSSSYWGLDGNVFRPNNVKTDDNYECNSDYIRLWLPRWSPDVWRNKHNYVLNVMTHIGDNDVVLGQLVFNRNDCNAGYKKLHSEEYFEYIDCEIPCPDWVVYSDELIDIRYGLGEPTGINNETSLLNISLAPIDIKLMELLEWDMGSVCLPIWKDTDSLKVNIESTHTRTTSKREIECKLVYNSYYDETLDGFKEYIKETYLLDDIELSWDMSIQDNENMWVYLTSAENDIKTSFTAQKIGFLSWDDYKDGMQIIVHCYIKHNDGIYCLTSNSIPVTKELYKYYIVNDRFATNINLAHIDMINYKINCVNKIQKNIINVERPKDYKANIIKPTFFRTSPSELINIYKEVSENICINLNKYKSQVETFYIKIEDAVFKEIGRVSEGVVFGITSGKLTKGLNEGTYYILNEDYVLITTGQYKYN